MSQTTVLGEAERIRQTYEGYDTTPSVRARRSPANVGNRWIARERHAAMERLLRCEGWLPLRETIILDVGCGSGGVLARMKRLGAQAHHLFGIDLLPGRIEAARRSHPDLHFSCGDASRLACADGSIDVVVLFGVMSSILDEGMARRMADEIWRVLKPGGAVLWYDFRYDIPWNPRVRGQRRQRIQRLFSRFAIRLQSITLLPPLARRLGRATPKLYPLLAAVPWLRSHYLGWLTKPQDP